VKASSSDFDAVYRAHAPSVFRRARVLLADDAEAQRVVSDVFGLLYDGQERYLGRPALTPLLYSLTTRACFNRLRNRSLQRRLAAGSQLATDDEEVARGTQLRDFVGHLNDRLSQLAVYYYLDELSQEEVSAILGCPKRGVDNLLLQLTAAASRAAAP
jgi:RNA polymerase sigma-70 factor (ECF subfamily)